MAAAKAVVAGGVFLGLCAASYTLYAGLFAGVAVLMALVVIVIGAPLFWMLSALALVVTSPQFAQPSWAKRSRL